MCTADSDFIILLTLAAQNWVQQAERAVFEL